MERENGKAENQKTEIEGAKEPREDPRHCPSQTRGVSEADEGEKKARNGNTRHIDGTLGR